MNRLLQTIVIMILVSFAFIEPGFAYVCGLAQPRNLAWEPWDLSTMGCQTIALGVGVASVNTSLFTILAYELLTEQGGFRLAITTWMSGPAIYTFSQGLVIGLIGDHMGGDGGFIAPIAAGGLSLALWWGALYFRDIHRDYHVPMLGGFMATTLLTQLAAYHISASLRGDTPKTREPSRLSNLSFGLAPTDGGASAGLSFQF